MRGLHLGLGLSQVVGTATPSAPAATSSFTMTQLATANRVYQRSTTTGGGQSKGQGSVPVTISSATAGTINARCRSVADGTTILQSEWVAATVANAATTATITGVDARLGWFYLDLRGSDGAWKLGTTAIGMGRLIGMAGQSLIEVMIWRNSSYGDPSTSIATAGATINPNGRALVSVAAFQASAWQQFQDVASTLGTYNSAGGTEMLDRQIQRFGVNCGLIGHVVGGTTIAQWQSGQANFTELSRVMALGGGAFEAFWWFQGHSDASVGYSTYLTALNSLLASVTGLSSYTPKFYLTTVPNATDDSVTVGQEAGAGTHNSVFQRHRAAEEWCTINNGVHVPFSDLTLTDNTHPNQVSTRRQANHFDRATAAESGGANDNGPVVTSMSKSGVNLVCTISQASGGTALVGTGSPATRMRITKTDDALLTALALDATTPLTIDSATQMTIKLASDPGDVNLELWPMGKHPVIDGAADVIRDDAAGAYGIGRQMKFPSVPVLRKSGAGALSTSGVTFAAGKFGNGRSNGEMKTSAKFLPSWPWDGCVLECWLSYVSAPTSLSAIMTQVGTMGLYIDASGNFQLMVNTTLSTAFAHGMTTGNTYHIRVEFSPIQFTQWVYVNGTKIATLAGTPGVGAANVFAVGGSGGGTGLLGTKGIIDEVAYFNRQLTKGANFTPPTSAYTDADPTGPTFLWHLDSSGAETGAP
jgi:hypothetical protein